jgi:hypothetical protein
LPYNDTLQGEIAVYMTVFWVDSKRGGMHLLS